SESVMVPNVSPKTHVGDQNYRSGGFGNLPLVHGTPACSALCSSDFKSTSMSCLTCDRIESSLDRTRFSSASCVGVGASSVVLQLLPIAPFNRPSSDGGVASFRFARVGSPPSASCASLSLLV